MSEHSESWGLDELNEMRMLVMMECDDGNFRQVRLTEEQFKRVSDAVWESGTPVPAGELEEVGELKDGMEIVDLDVPDEPSVPSEWFDGMSSCEK